MKALYAFSGDPITYGHIDIIERATKLFDFVVIGIGVNPNKNYTFTLEERLDMARESLKNLSNIEVVAFEGQLVDFAYENNIGVIIRGIRNNHDLNYEYDLFRAGMSQNLGIETFPIFAKPEYSHISSSMVKAIIKEQGKIDTLVTPYVKRKLEEKILGQYLISVTGSIGVGKSHVASKLVEIGRKNRIPVWNIDLDVVSHEILSTLQEPMYVEIRKQIIDKFGNELKNEDGSINRKLLAEKVFNNKENLEFLNKLMDPAINERMRRVMYGKNGILLINAALLIERNYISITNNNVLLITASLDVQKKRLRVRGYTEDEIKRRIDNQFDSSKKLKQAEKTINETKYGKIWTLDTTLEDENDIYYIFDKILEEFKLDEKVKF